MINIEISKFNLKNNLESKKFLHSEVIERIKYLNKLSYYKIINYSYLIHTLEVMKKV